MRRAIKGFPPFAKKKNTSRFSSFYFRRFCRGFESSRDKISNSILCNGLVFFCLFVMKQLAVVFYFLWVKHHVNAFVTPLLGPSAAVLLFLRNPRDWPAKLEETDHKIGQIRRTLMLAEIIQLSTPKTMLVGPPAYRAWPLSLHPLLSMEVAVWGPYRPLVFFASHHLRL